MIIWEPKRKNPENRDTHLEINDITAGMPDPVMELFGDIDGYFFKERFLDDECNEDDINTDSC